MSIGYRPQGSAGPLYHPERDFAYITPTLMRQAIDNMSEPPNPEIEEWKKANNIGEAEIIAAAEALADAQRDFVSTADPVTSLHQALHRHDYFALPVAVRLLLQAMVGEVMIGAWFRAVREVSIKGEESPVQNEMCRFSAAVREFAAANGAPKPNPVSTAETVLAQNDVLRGRFEALRGEYKALQQKLYETENKVTKLEMEQAHLPGWWRRITGWWRKPSDGTTVLSTVSGLACCKRN